MSRLLAAVVGAASAVAALAVPAAAVASGVLPVPAITGVSPAGPFVPAGVVTVGVGVAAYPPAAMRAEVWQLDAAGTERIALLGSDGSDGSAPFGVLVDLTGRASGEVVWLEVVGYDTAGQPVAGGRTVGYVVDAYAPWAQFAVPAVGRVHRGMVTVAVQPRDSDSWVTGAALYAGDVRVSDVVTDEPWGWLGELWPLTADISKFNGRRSLRVVTWDGAGNAGSSRAFDIVADNTAPVAAITGGPRNGSRVTGTVVVTAAATDAVSVVAKVELLAGGTPVGADLTAPYAFRVPPGRPPKTAAIALRVTDRVGNIRTTGTLRTWRR